MQLSRGVPPSPNRALCHEAASPPSSRSQDDAGMQEMSPAAVPSAARPEKAPVTAQCPHWEKINDEN